MHCLNKDENGEGGSHVGIRERTFQAEETASPTDPRREATWDVQRTARNPVGLQQENRK